MSEPKYYHPHIIHYRNMSNRQRHAVLIEELKVPKHLLPMLKANDTGLIKIFNQGFHLMVKGKIPFNAESLKIQLDKIDATRWATPKPDKGEKE